MTTTKLRAPPTRTLRLGTFLRNSITTPYVVVSHLIFETAKQSQLLVPDTNGTFCLPKVEVIVATSRLRSILDSIVKASRTGQVGDGKIFVTDLASVVRIRTGQVDEAAV